MMLSEYNQNIATANTIGGIIFMIFIIHVAKDNQF